MKLQLSVIILIFLCTTTPISSTSKDHKMSESKNTQNMEKLLNLNPNQSQYEQGLQDQQDTFEKQFKTQTSKYNGVCWLKDNKKWEASLYNKKKYYGGLFDNEKQAAMKVNLLCDKMGIERKNPMIIIEPDEMKQRCKNQTSIYIGVCWHKDAKRWQARLILNKKVYHGGLFDNEEQAAMKVNLLCDKNGIQRKNPTVIIEPDAIQKVPKKNFTIQWSLLAQKCKKMASAADAQ